MKNLLFIILFSFAYFSSYSQEVEYKEYSYTEFFELIELEQDTVFTLKDAIIRFNEETDSIFVVKTSFLGKVTPTIEFPTIVIDKDINLKNLHFDFQYSGDYAKGTLNNIHFLKSVQLRKVNSISLHNSKVDGVFSINNNELCEVDRQVWSDLELPIVTELGFNQFNKGFNFVRFCHQEASFFMFRAFDNVVKTNNNGTTVRWDNYRVAIKNEGWITLLRNKIIGDGIAHINCISSRTVSISDNQFSNAFLELKVERAQEGLKVNQNDISSNINLDIDEIKPSDVIEWNQFGDQFISDDAFENYRNLFPDKEYNMTDSDSFRTVYRERIRIQNPQVYAGETALRGVLYRHYRSKFDMVSANAVYINLKDLETKRLKYIHEQDRSFDTYFQWKVNQFLKVFSNYGTKPSKAIVYSVYVILLFGLIYLFFPNSWDSHGRNRIIDRYTFFMKYMRKKAGIHEVYMEDKKDDLLSYEKFKGFVESSEHEVPRIFTGTALPLYKWAVSGTRISSAFLKRVDIMQGTWSDLSEGKKWWKGMLLIGAFTVAIIYDLMIKMLNALMLSINTFTTLGFGEIPIKGLPRYLAIIEGFIGWFMLTIFSVSLISQLLN